MAPLDELEQHHQRGEAELLAYLRGKTKRSPAALRAALKKKTPWPASLAEGDDVRRRAAPFLGLAALDAHGSPVVVARGQLYVTPAPGRRRHAAHYTPRTLADYVARRALEPLVYEETGPALARSPRRLRPADELLALRVCDLACGGGALLLAAARYLADRLYEAWADPAGDPRLALRMVAQRCLYGVDRDPLAIDVARWSLCLLTGLPEESPAWQSHLRLGDSLVDDDGRGGASAEDSLLAESGFHWRREFPEVFAAAPGFDAVIGNPPWGQKSIDVDPRLKRYVRANYPSCGGLFDLFRPFVEKAVRSRAPAARGEWSCPTSCC